MNLSFYVGALGAKASLKKMDVTANNLANVNNTGFKPKTAVFSDLLNYNLNDSENARTELMAGNGVRLEAANTSFDTSGATFTGSSLDYAIQENNAFFMLQDPVTGQISFTRDGHFHRGEQEDGFYVMTDSGKLVLDQNGEPLKAEVTDVEKLKDEMEGEYEEEDEEEEYDEDAPRLALYTFSNPSHLLNIGDNEFVPPEGMEAELLERARAVSGMLETSGTDVAKEMVHLIECQRAYSYALKMVTTSDEIEQTVNTLRG